MDDVNNFLSKLLFFCIFLYKKNKKKIGYGITSGLISTKTQRRQTSKLLTNIVKSQNIISIMSTNSKNMHGYSDYSGPSQSIQPLKRSENLIDETNKKSLDSPSSDADADSDETEEEENDFFNVGFWMEGDSLAPPCGAAIHTIHEMLKLAGCSEKDVVWDLGCGDGRICLEAFVHFKVQHAVGVEIEDDLVDRFQFLIDNLKNASSGDENEIGGKRTIQVVHQDLLKVLDSISDSDSNDQEKLSSSSSISDLPKPSILFLYLLPESIEKIQPKLEQFWKREKDRGGIPELKIVCNTWGLKGDHIQPMKTIEVAVEGENEYATIHLFTRDSLIVASTVEES